MKAASPLPPVAEGVEEIYNRYLSLSSTARIAFLALLKGTGEMKEDRPSPSSPGHLPAQLYARIATKLYSYRGIKLPPLLSLRKTSAEEELFAAVEWLRAGKKTLSLQESAGIIEMAAEAVTREIYWGAKHDRMSMKRLILILARIPATVEQAFPGYRENGMILSVAARIGEGNLPLVKDTE